MVLDIRFFRDDPDVPTTKKDVETMQSERNKDVGAVQAVTDIDAAWRKCDFAANQGSKLFNTIKRVNGAKRKAKVNEDGMPTTLSDAQKAKGVETTDAEIEAMSTSQLNELSKLVKVANAKNKEEAAKLLEDRQKALLKVGNMLHSTTPKFADEEDNVVERTIGPVGDANRKKYSHVDLIYMIGGVNTAAGSVTAGNRGYYLTGPAVALEIALVSYAHQFLLERGFSGVSPPVFMRKECMQEVAQLSQFDDELYKVIGKASEVETDTAIDEKYLIATSEQPIAAFHRKQRLAPGDLPIKYVGISECFRQEVGSHGRDTLGIFRVHQFKKVEQFVICSPRDGESWKIMDEMIDNAEDFTKSLGLSYQIINIVSGALNLAASKKLDLEAWFPGSGTFRELVSCSNCTDYQARRLDIRFGQGKSSIQGSEFVHMLNSTLCATTRMICCIMESYQFGDLESKGGIVVPDVLKPFMPQQYKEFIPFVNPAPIDQEAAKKKGKSKGKK